MRDPLAADIVVWSLQDMAFEWLKFLAEVIIDFFCVQKFDSDPCRILQNIEEAVRVLWTTQSKSSIDSLDVIFAHKIIIVTISIEIKLKLLLKLESRIYWSLALILFILKINTFKHKILSEEDIFEKFLDVSVFFTTLSHFWVASYNLVRNRDPILFILVVIFQHVSLIEMLHVGAQQFVNTDGDIVHVSIPLKVFLFTTFELGYNRGRFEILGSHDISLDLNIFSQLVIIESKLGIPSVCVFSALLVVDFR